MLDPRFIKFEKTKNKLYLTFSASVKDKQRILGIQNQIKKIMAEEEMLKDLPIETDRENLYKWIAQKNRFIYQYPKGRLHLSIVNFATYDIEDLQDFEYAKETIKKTANFKLLRQKIKEFERLFLESFGDKRIKANIQRIYLPAGIEDSLALNIFPIEENFLKKLMELIEIIKKDMEKEFICHNLKLKAYPEEAEQYFVLNMFRFICEDDKPVKQGGSFYERIEDISDDFKKELFIEIEPRIAISDPYLANDEPWKID